MTFGKSSGRAGEYWDHYFNFITGCQHNCKYCWARRYFSDRGDPVRVTDSVASIERYVEKHRPKEVMLCNTSDMYQGGVDPGLRREVIEKFTDLEVPICVLTKSGAVVEDLDLLKEAAARGGARVGVSVTTLDPETYSHWEPGAPPPEARLDALHEAHLAGIDTWISVEPVLDEESPTQILEEAHSYTDEIWYGRLNYYQPLRRIDLDKVRHAVIMAAEAYRAKVMFKRGFRGVQEGQRPGGGDARAT